MLRRVVQLRTEAKRREDTLWGEDYNDSGTVLGQRARISS